MDNTEAWDYNKIVSDKELFYKTIYTPLSDALKILEERQKDESLRKKIEELLERDIPECFNTKEKNGYQFRQIATPNYEGQWFIKITKAFDLGTNFCEFKEDKFTTNNNFKLSLGQIKIHSGFDCSGNPIIEKNNIIDIKENDGKKLKDIVTNWGESLSDFHRKSFEVYNILEGIKFHDLSSWHKNHNDNSIDNYVSIFLLFITHGILFENFLIDGSEKLLTERVILPALERVTALTGLKPLIVPVPPMDKEFDDFIVYHLPLIKKIIK